MRRASGTLTNPMSPVIVYSTTWCPWCDRAKALLKARGIPYDNVNIETQPDFRQKLVELTGGYTVPQIVIGEKPIGGFRELRALDASGELAELLAA
jgi:glutaredoxin 3